MDPWTHETLRQLIHFVDDGPAHGFPSGAFKLILGRPFPTGVNWYKDSSQTELLLEKIIYPPLIQPTAITWRIYATGGTAVAQSLTDFISYTGPFEASRIRSIDP